MWNNSRIIGSFCFVFERTNSPNKKNDIRVGYFVTLNYPLNLFLNLEGFFYVLFSGSYLSAHTKQNLSIHSISENGRKPVKKISASATVLLTLKVEVQSPYNRITISYNRKGHRAFAVFLLSIFVGKCRRAVSDMRCRSPPLHLDFLHFKNSDGRYLW